MMTTDVDIKRRAFLTKTTLAVTSAGVAATCIPFVSYMLPSATAEAAAGPVKVDISQLKPGEQKTVEWRGRPVWIIHRTEAMLKSLAEPNGALSDPESKVHQQPQYAQNIYRSIKPEILVLVGVCTHLGCAPTYRPDKGGIDANWPGGFFCSCHGSKFDMAGRVYKNVPAPINLEVPKYAFIDDQTLLIGVDRVPSKTTGVR